MRYIILLFIFNLAVAQGFCQIKKSHTIKKDSVTVNWWDTIHLSLKEVCVTGQYEPQAADKSIYYIKMIDSRQIQSMAANNLSDLLSNELNVDIIRDNAIGSSGMVLKGLSGEHVRVLVDGVPLIGRMNGNIDLNQINLNNVDHIEIVEGPLSVQYGSNALGGAINIITKDNKCDKISANLDSYYETIGIYNFTGSVSTSFGNNTFGASGGRNFFDGFKLIDTLRSFLFAPKRQYFASAFYGYNYKKFKFKLSASYFDELMIDKGDLQPVFDYVKAFDTWHYTKRFNNVLDAGYKLNDVISFKMTGAYSFYELCKNTYFNDLTTLNKVITKNSDEQDTTQFTGYLFRVDMSSFSFSKKLNFQLGTETNIERGEGKRIHNRAQEIDDYALYGTLQYKLIQNLIFQPGLRISYNSKYQTPVIPSVNFKYNLGEYSSFRISFSHGFRSPTLKELYLQFFDSNHQLFGNPDLKSEHSVNTSFFYNFNIEKQRQWFSNVKIDFSLYYNRIKDIISMIPVDINNPLRWSYTNINNYNSYGGYLNFKFSVTRDLTFAAGYTQNAKFESDLETAKSLNDFRYFNNINSSLSYTYEKIRTTFSLFYKYNGKYPLVYYDQANQMREGYIGAYHNMDISVAKKLFKDLFVLSIGVKNLFNNTSIASSGSEGVAFHANSTSSTTVNWGRTYFFKLGINISKSKQ